MNNILQLSRSSVVVATIPIIKNIEQNWTYQSGYSVIFEVYNE